MAPAQTARVVLRIPDRWTGVKINSQMKEPAAPSAARTSTHRRVVM